MLVVLSIDSLNVFFVFLIDLLYVLFKVNKRRTSINPAVSFPSL